MVKFLSVRLQDVFITGAAKQKLSKISTVSGFLAEVVTITVVTITITVMPCSVLLFRPSI